MDEPGGGLTQGSPSTFVGRRAELAELRAGLQDAGAGRGRLFAVTGNPGIGKTRLAEEMARHASEKSVPVLWGQAWEGGEAPAFWPWTHILRSLSASFGADRLAEVAADRQPYLTRVAPDLGTGSGDIVEDSRWELFDAVTSTLIEVSQSDPLLLIFDDLHAADESSLALLRMLARGLRNSRLTVLALYREADPASDPAVKSSLSDIEREGARIPLTGLARDEVSDLIRAATGRDPFAELVDTMLRATEGNPLFLHEFIRLLTSEIDLRRADESTGFLVPTSIREVMRKRLEPLSRESLGLLSLASIVGREFDASILGEIAGLDTSEVLSFMEETSKAGIVAQTSALGTFRFTHVLIRETLYEEQGVAERMRRHAQVAAILEDRYGEVLEEHLPELAHHWFKAAQAGNTEKMMQYSLAAASRAESLGAYEEAARLYRRALRAADLGRLDTEERAGLVKMLREVEARLPARENFEPAGGQGRSARRGAAPERECALTQEGDHWIITFEDETTRLNDSKGLRYIAELIRAPGREFHVLDLVTILEPPEPGPRGTVDPEPSTVPAGEAVHEAIDARAQVQYKRRLIELEEDLQEAESFNDTERASRIRAELDFIASELARSVGLGGRRRKEGSFAEKARLSVRKAIRTTIGKVMESNPELGKHLSTSIRTGRFCSYDPAPSFKITWKA